MPRSGSWLEHLQKAKRTADEHLARCGGPGRSPESQKAQVLGHGNAQAFKDCKEDWADEAGNDLDVMRQTLPRKARS